MMKIKKILKLSLLKIMLTALFMIIFSFSAQAGIDDDFHIDAASGTYDSSGDFERAKGVADEELGRNGHPELQFQYEDPDLQKAMNLRANENGYTSSDNSQDVYEILGINKKACSIEAIRKDFLDGATAKNCWYCNIVSTMTNSFLTAVAESNGVVQTLALLILRYGFLIWLAYYILQQVSSLAPIKISKMLQDILMMGFKVLLATLAVRQGIPLLTEFFIDPVMLLGVDYGQEMLDGLMEANIGTTQTPTPTPGTFGGGSFDGNGATSRW